MAALINFIINNSPLKRFMNWNRLSSFDVLGFQNHCLLGYLHHTLVWKARNASVRPIMYEVTVCSYTWKLHIETNTTVDLLGYGFNSWKNSVETSFDFGGWYRIGVGEQDKNEFVTRILLNLHGVRNVFQNVFIRYKLIRKLSVGYQCTSRNGFYT